MNKLFSFGAVADIQYANVDNGYDFHQTKMRYYRSSKDQLIEVVDTWNKNDVDFAVQLGDLIDGKCRKVDTNNESLNEFLAIMKKFKSTGVPVCKYNQGYKLLNADSSDKIAPYICHIWGNHEFYNLSRSELWLSDLNSYIFSEKINFYNKDFDYYYSFVYKGFRMISLDVYEIATISSPKGSEIYETALNLLKENNELYPDIMTPGKNKPCYVSWNGGVSKNQLNWLENELSAAKLAQEKVIIFTHSPLHPASTSVKSTCWNYEDILSLLHQSQCVVACFSGHDHDGGFYHDNVNKIYFITMEGVLERAPNENSFAIVDVYNEKIELNGYGITQSKILTF